jgi:hypothetical protein
VDNINMVSVGSLVKLKYTTQSTIVDKDKGLIDCWLEIENPGIVVYVNQSCSIPSCDISFGGQIF